MGDEVKVGDRCTSCGRGHIKEKLGYFCCDYCGRVKLVKPHVTYFAKLRDGTRFIFANEEIGEGRIYLKGRPPMYVSDNPREIEPNCYEEDGPATAYASAGPLAWVIKL
jgi:DNA-directed RNA polymerase subunit RPC12/RpoP